MAEPSEGAYALINVASQKALDVYWKDNAYQTWIIGSTRNTDWICQTWILDKQSNGWQITNYATWGCLDATDNTYAKQVSDNNKTVQRWTIATDGNTFTYGGTSYPTYTITSKSSSSKKLVTRSDKWIGLANSTANAARWILVKANVLSDEGTYYIVPANSTSSCIEIASGSKANKAWAVVNKRNSKKSYQTFKVSINQENFSVKLINQNSNKALDIWVKPHTSTPENVGQYQIESNSTSQRWYIARSGTLTINKVKYPTYTIRSEKSEYTNYYMTVSGQSIKMATLSSGSSAQRFAFIPTEYLDNSLTVPGKVSPTSFVIKGAGTATVSKLKFSSSYKKFQARYMLKKYKPGRKSSEVVKTTWVNTKGNSKANNGWGPAGTYSFSATPSKGVVTIPSFSRKYKLDTKNCVAIDFVIQIRAFEDITKNGTVFKNARSTEQETVIKIRQRPTISIKSLSLVMDPGGTSPSDDKIGVRIVLGDSLNEGFERLSCRLIGSDSIPISGYVSTTSTSVSFYAGTDLYRLPYQNENVGIEYSILTKKDKIQLKGSLKKNFSYSTASSVAVSYAPSNNGSLTAIVKAPRHDADCCFMEVKFLSGTKLIPCKYHKLENDEIQWLAVPPLNKDVQIVVYSKTKTSTKVLSGTTTIRMDSHTSIWNWGTSPKAKCTQFATLIVNPDSPPQQKRSFTTDLQFHNPAGRVLPVAFSSKALSIDLSVTGVSVDEDAKYVASEQMPPHNEVEYLILLSELAGKGIHPIYRTPYGDWYQVGVSAVDVSKNAMNYSDVAITQRALED